MAFWLSAPVPLGVPDSLDEAGAGEGEGEVAEVDFSTKSGGGVDTVGVVFTGFFTTRVEGFFGGIVFVLVVGAIFAGVVVAIAVFTVVVGVSVFLEITVTGVVVASLCSACVCPRKNGPGSNP